MKPKPKIGIRHFRDPQGRIFASVAVRARNPGPNMVVAAALVHPADAGSATKKGARLRLVGRLDVLEKLWRSGPPRYKRSQPRMAQFMYNAVSTGDFVHRLIELERACDVDGARRFILSTFGVEIGATWERWPQGGSNPLMGRARKQVKALRDAGVGRDLMSLMDRPLVAGSVDLGPEVAVRVVERMRRITER